MDLQLKNHKVLITGSTKGIGLGIATSLLEEGAQVLLCARDEARLRATQASLRERFGDEAVEACVCDVENEQSLKHLYDFVEKRWGKLDSLICNVGSGAGPRSVIPDKEPFDKTLRLNFSSAVDTTRLFFDLLSKARGNLILIGSIAGLEDVGAPASYTAAKAALGAFAKSISRRFSEHHVRVNVVAPGNIYFEGGSWDRRLKEDSKLIDIMLKAKVPMQRFGAPKEIGSVCAFMCSPQAQFINGSTIVVDGGQVAGI